MKFFILLLFFLNIINANILELTDDFKVANTREFAKIFIDKEKKLTFQEIRENRDNLFKDSNRSNFLNSNVNIWINFSLKNSSNKIASYTLVNNLFVINNIDFYRVK